MHRESTYGVPDTWRDWARSGGPAAGGLFSHLSKPRKRRAGWGRFWVWGCSSPRDEKVGVQAPKAEEAGVTDN